MNDDRPRDAERTRPTSTDPVISFDGVSGGYNGVEVISDVSLDVHSGDIVGLLGPNGVGKSTLLKCAVGLLDPLAGEVAIGDRPVPVFDRDELARTVGYVPQHEPTNFPRTVFQTVLMGRKPHFGTRPSARDRNVVSTLLHRLSLDEFAMRDVNALSGGQRQKVILARALAQEPRALVLDEPTSDLDIRHEVEVLSLLQREAPNGLAILHAMHDLTLAFRYSDRIVLLGEDGVRTQGPPEAISAAAISEVYGIDVSIHDVDGETLIVPTDSPADPSL
ncbi:ABC transporter ATP-binding protein [Halobellus captivus]|uniref:ABC transporter ATP-binding protein n=1 Tax=Halobellus captivus TaxID=2592614 RepID=UPI00139699CD|nr:ABC transporter ATP-binding protein [Halobellus captivus]